MTKRCVSLRMRLREGPVQLASRLGIAPSTGHRILTAVRLNRLSHIDRATGEPIRRYEHPHPGSLGHGKVERFHRALTDGWAYARCYQSETERRGALEAWLHHHNQHRPHTACGNQPPFSRLINVPGQYS